MPNWLRRIFAFPSWLDEEQTRISRLLSTILWIGIGLTGLAGISSLLSSRPQAVGLWLIGGIFLVHASSLLLLRLGFINPVRIIYPAAALVITTATLYFSGGLSGLGMSAYIVVTMLAMLLQGGRGGANYFLASIAASLFILILQSADLLPSPTIANTTMSSWLSQVIVFLWITALLYQLNESHNNALRRARANETALGESVGELQATRSTLERHTQALERHIVQLQVAAEIARDAAALGKMEELIERAVNLVRDRFGFYHAGIFLVDERGQYAVLRAATGEPGRKMIENAHRLKVGEVGIVGYVTGSGMPRIALDVGADAVYFQNPYLPETHSELALPLKIGNRIIGALDVQNKQESAFNSDDITILQTMADQLAVAIENARLYDAARRQVEELTILHAIATAGAETTSQDALIERATLLIGTTLYPAHFGVLLLDEKTNGLRFHPSYHGLDERNKQTIIPLGKGISGRVATTGQPIRATDVTREVEYINIHAGMRSELCVPLKIGERIIGVINAESSVANDFTDADERLLSTFAGQLSTAIEKARLFEAERRRAAELEALRQASLHLTSNLDLQAVLEAILIHAIQLIHADTAHLFLYDGEHLTFGTALETDDENNLTVVRSHEREFDTPRPGGITQTVASTGERVVIPDVSAHPLFRSRPWDGAIIALPLRNGEQVCGVMNISFTGGPHQFDENELRILELLADQASIALVNARLYAESQDRATVLAETLRQREELARLEAEFVQNVSHELRTPLSIIRGYIEMLDSGDLGPVPPEQVIPISIVARRVIMLSKLVDDLTAVLETEARETRKEAVNLLELARKAQEDFESAARQAEVTLRVDLPEALPAVMGNSSHLYRVFDNLIGNAIKFTPAGGEVGMKIWQEGDSDLIEVSDTGVGIPADQMGRIFERFYQVDGSTTRRYGGTGLGLALVKEITEAHGGCVSVQSTPEVGSKFLVRLPAAS